MTRTKWLPLLLLLSSSVLASPLEKLEEKCTQEIFENAGVRRLSQECEHVKLKGEKVCIFAAEHSASSAFLGDCESAQTLGAGVCTAVTIKMGRSPFAQGCETYSTLGAGLCAAAAVRNGINPTSVKCSHVQTVAEGNCAVKVLTRGRGRIVSILPCIQAL